MIWVYIIIAIIVVIALVYWVVSRGKKEEGEISTGETGVSESPEEREGGSEEKSDSSESSEKEM